MEEEVQEREAEHRGVFKFGIIQLVGLLLIILGLWIPGGLLIAFGCYKAYRYLRKEEEE